MAQLLQRLTKHVQCIILSLSHNVEYLHVPTDSISQDGVLLEAVFFLNIRQLREGANIRRDGS